MTESDRISAISGDSIRFGQVRAHYEHEIMYILMAISFKNKLLILSWVEYLERDSFVDCAIIQKLLNSDYHYLIPIIHKKGASISDLRFLEYDNAISRFETVLYLLENDLIPPKPAELARLACKTKKFKNIDKVAKYCDCVTLVQAAKYVGNVEISNYLEEKIQFNTYLGVYQLKLN